MGTQYLIITFKEPHIRPSYEATPCFLLNPKDVLLINLATLEYACPQGLPIFRTDRHKLLLLRKNVIPIQQKLPLKNVDFLIHGFLPFRTR